MIISTDFESGSVGKIEKINDSEWTLSLKNDNSDETLPDKWRSWWYVKLDQVATDRAIKINITNRGRAFYDRPVYSYDQKNWKRFDEEDVKQDNSNGQKPTQSQLHITKQFSQSLVWLARFYPYTTSQLEHYLASISDFEPVRIEQIGLSTLYKKPLYLLTITNFSQAKQAKKRVWIHTRAHPGETAGSFVVEGLIDFLLKQNKQAQNLLRDYIFHIAPMYNPDGIILGNYRTTQDEQGKTVNLEEAWLFDEKNPLPLTENAPTINRLFNKKLRELFSEEEKAAFVLAINIHSSNEPPNRLFYLIPHFGDNPNVYTPEQIDLWKKQIALIHAINKNFNNRIHPPPTEGGKTFLDLYYPETWWWANKKNKVNAITLETNYGKAGFDHWPTPNELRQLGQAIALAIAGE